MKTISTIIFSIVLTCNLVAAQDTLYIYKSGAVVTKRAVNDIDSVIFYKALDPTAVVDIVGNVYHTVTIGAQTWMVENVKTTKYNDGTSISNITDGTTWSNITTPGYCYYNNDVANKSTYGALYNWYTVNTGKLAPTGWHIPTFAEWTTLENYLIANGFNYDGTTTGNKIAKSLAATSGWSTSTYTGTIGNDLTKNNTSGFAGLPGGYRIPIGTFGDVGNYAYWWSSTETSTDDAWARYLDYAWTHTLSGSGLNKRYGFSVRCLRDDNVPVLGVPTLSTTATYNITATSATSGGIITSDGGSAITAHGVCWNTSPNPTIANSKTNDGTGLGGFTSSITDLTTSTLYYVRAYAINSVGMTYGNEVSFTTQSSVTDIDGNVYSIVKIGTQVWMVENLKTTKYNDGTSILNITDNTAWKNLTTPGYCFYNNDAANKNIYGALYNWYTVNTGKLAPTGWHVPTDAEWTSLTTYLTDNGYGYGGSGSDIAKSMASTFGWNSSLTVGTVGNDQASNNSSRFAGLPGAFRYYYGSFHYIGNDGSWWSYTEHETGYAWVRGLNYNNSSVSMGYSAEQYGFSVRCVRD